MSSPIDRTITKEQPLKICFVCLGNICRSPTAEGVMQHLINEQNLESYFEIDSSGTSAYHVGESANSKSQQTAQKHGITLHSRARKFETSDLEYFDLILAMDSENLSNIRRMDAHNNYSDKIGKLRDFDPRPEDGNIPDPYYGGIDGFENVFQIVKRCCNNLLDELKPHIEK